MTTTNYLYDGANIVQELSGTTPTANLLAGLSVDELFTRTDATWTANFLTDALGSTLALADSSGTVQTAYAYEPFGNTTVSGGSTTPYQYTGRENDGTGLYFHRARYYQPAPGRFISEDPIGFGGGANLYTYVGNDPVVFSDPVGHDKKPQGRPPDPSWTSDFLSNLFSLSGYMNEFEDGGCIATFVDTVTSDPISDITGVPHFDQTLQSATTSAAYTGALAYAAYQGLMVPMRSSVVRGILQGGETMAGTISVGLLDITLLRGLVHELQSIGAGTCH